MPTKASWQQILIGPWEHPLKHPKRWSLKQSIEDRHVHKGEEGNRVTPSYRHKLTTNFGPGIAKPREGWGITLSQTLPVPEEWPRAFKWAWSWMLLDWKRWLYWLWFNIAFKSFCEAEEMGMLGNNAEAVSSSGKWCWSKSADKSREASSQMLVPSQLAFLLWWFGFKRTDPICWTSLLYGHAIARWIWKTALYNATETITEVYSCNVENGTIRSKWTILQLPRQLRRR